MVDKYPKEEIQKAADYISLLANTTDEKLEEKNKEIDIENKNQAVLLSLTNDNANGGGFLSNNSEKNEYIFFDNNIYLIQDNKIIDINKNNNPYENYSSLIKKIINLINYDNMNKIIKHMIEVKELEKDNKLIDINKDYIAYVITYYHFLNAKLFSFNTSNKILGLFENVKNNFNAAITKLNNNNDYNNDYNKIQIMIILTFKEDACTINLKQILKKNTFDVVRDFNINGEGNNYITLSTEALYYEYKILSCIYSILFTLVKKMKAFSVYSFIDKLKKKVETENPQKLTENSIFKIFNSIDEYYRFTVKYVKIFYDDTNIITHTRKHIKQRTIETEVVVGAGWTVTALTGLAGFIITAVNSPATHMAASTNAFTASYWAPVGVGLGYGSVGAVVAVADCGVSAILLYICAVSIIEYKEYDQALFGNIVTSIVNDEKFKQRDWWGSYVWKKHPVIKSLKNVVDSTVEIVNNTIQKKQKPEIIVDVPTINKNNENTNEIKEPTQKSILPFSNIINTYNNNNDKLPFEDFRKKYDNQNKAGKHKNKTHKKHKNKKPKNTKRKHTKKYKN